MLTVSFRQVQQSAWAPNLIQDLVAKFVDSAQLKPVEKPCQLKISRCAGNAASPGFLTDRLGQASLVNTKAGTCSCLTLPCLLLPLSYALQVFLCKNESLPCRKVGCLGDPTKSWLFLEWWADIGPSTQLGRPMMESLVENMNGLYLPEVTLTHKTS